MDGRSTFTTRKSSLLDPFVKEITIGGDVPEGVALAVTRHTERGNSDRARRKAQAKVK